MQTSRKVHINENLRIPPRESRLLKMKAEEIVEAVRRKEFSMVTIYQTNSRHHGLYPELKKAIKMLAELRAELKQKAKGVAQRWYDEQFYIN